MIPVKRRIYSLLMLLFLSASTSSRADKPKLRIGDTAPPLTATIEGHPAESFQKGRIYVIEFWATWCGACLATFNHVNGLVHALKNEPITFISVTDEKKVNVDLLLKTRPLQTRIAYDRESKTFDTYGVRVIPHTVVVGKDGKIVAITNPLSLTKEVLQDVLASKPANLPEKTNISADLEWDKQIDANAPEALAQVIVQRSNADSGASHFRPNSGQIIGDGISIGALIQIAYNAQFFEIKSKLPGDDKKRYRISVRSPDGKDATARTLLRGVLSTLVGFSARWLEEETPVLVLTHISGAAKPTFSTKKKYDGFARNGEIDYVAAPMREIALTLGMIAYNNNVVDETGYKDTYDIKLSWIPGNKKSFEEALKSHGLKIKKEKRKVRRLYIQPVQRAGE